MSRRATESEIHKGAALRVIRLLERRWRDRLPDGRFPRRALPLMQKRPEFEAMVQRVIRYGALPFPDLDFHPVVTRAPDGTIRDLMMDELGFDPADFVCIDCGDEIDRGKQRCDPCSHWRRTGVAR